MKITARYASAVHSGNLKSVETTTYSDSDVLAAFAIADRRLSNGIDRRTKHPLAAPLQRLFTGDNTAAQHLVGILAGMAAGKARALRLDITRTRCLDMAAAVLAWFRNPSCKACGGHGYDIILGTVSLGPVECRPCVGKGKVPIDKQFRQEHRELVDWLVARVAMESAMAGVEAMKAIAPRLEL